MVFDTVNIAPEALGYTVGIGYGNIPPHKDMFS